MPYVTAIMCSTAARTGMRSAAPPASESTRSASGRRRCDASSLRLTRLALRALPRPDQEAGAPARLAGPAGLPVERVRCQVHVQGLDVHDLVERALPERVSTGEVSVAEGDVREVLRPPLLLGHLDQRAVGVEPGDRESALGQQAREVAGAARDVEHAHLAPVDGGGYRRLDQGSDLLLEPLVWGEALEDIVVHDAVRDREHPIEAPVEATKQGVHDTPRHSQGPARRGTGLHPFA